MLSVQCSALLVRLLLVHYILVDRSQNSVVRGDDGDDDAKILHPIPPRSSDPRAAGPPGNRFVEHLRVVWFTVCLCVCVCACARVQETKRKRERREW